MPRKKSKNNLKMKNDKKLRRKSEMISENSDVRRQSLTTRTHTRKI